MVVRCERSISDYRYLVMFDLASHNTGVCLWDLHDNRPVFTKAIVSEKKDGIFVSNLYGGLCEYFDLLKSMHIDWKDIFVSKEAMPVQLRGGSSTVQTFIALAKAHAILDLFLELHDIDVYDYTGVYPATTHAYLKKVLGLDSKTSVDKKDVKKFVEETYCLEFKTFDESDAAFLACTLVNSKWNKDIDEKIKEVKKHKKTLKQKKAIEDCDALIEKLENMRH